MADDPVGRHAAIYARMERDAKAEKIARNRDRMAKWNAGRPQRQARNTAAQAAYRERHAKNLRLARRVAGALMGLRRKRVTYTCLSRPLFSVAEALRKFLDQDEVLALRNELRRGPP